MPAMSALTTFVDGTLVHQSDLNNLPANIDTLCQQTTGKTAADLASTKPILRVALTASQSITYSAEVAVLLNWHTATTNTDTMWTGTAPTNRIIINTPGWYRVLAQVTWVGSAAASDRVIEIMVNGTADPINVTSSNNQVMGATPTNPFRQQVSGYERLAAGASLYIAVYQSTGAAINALHTPFGTWCTVAWDAPY